MQELFLNHAEFLAVLGMLGATAIVGADAEQLFPSEKAEREALLREGRLQLEQRFLTTEGLSHDDLLRVVRIVAYPQTAVMLIREVIPIGPQVFVLSQSTEGIIEHTCPREGVHRLVSLPDIPALLVRATQILSLHSQDPINASVEMERQAFFTLHDLVRHNQHDLALKILQHAGMLCDAAEAFVTAMEQPIFSGEIVMLKCSDQIILDARDIVVVQDQQTAWYVMQVAPDQLPLRVQSVHERAMYDVLSRCFAQLAA